MDISIIILRSTHNAWIKKVGRSCHPLINTTGVSIKGDTMGDEEAIVHCGTTKGDITLQLIRVSIEWVSSTENNSTG